MFLFNKADYSWPIAKDVGEVISSPYGNRPNPLYEGNVQFHKGVDIVFDGKTKAVVYPIALCKIISVIRDHRQIGNAVVYETGLEHGDMRLRINCFHLDSIADIKRGDMCEAISALGLMGETGATTGVHLHLQVALMTQGKGESFDPMSLFNGGLIVIDGKTVAVGI